MVNLLFLCFFFLNVPSTLQALIVLLQFQILVPNELNNLTANSLNLQTSLHCHHYSEPASCSSSSRYCPAEQLQEPELFAWQSETNYAITRNNNLESRRKNVAKVYGVRLATTTTTTITHF